MLRRARAAWLLGGVFAILPLALARAATPSDAPSATDGLIRSSALRRGQAIKVDGHVVGTTPAAVAVPCGEHKLAVGRGRTQRVTVPCGGELVLGRKKNRIVEADAGASPDTGASHDVGDASTSATPATGAAAGGGSSTSGEPANDAALPSSTSTAAPSASAPASAAPPAPEEAPPAEPAAPEALPLGGRIFTYVRVPTSANPIDAPLQQVSASAWLEAKPRFNEWSSATAVVSVDAMRSSIDPGTNLRARVREAYVDAYKNGWELRLGQQIIPWGNADIVNPTDFLSAKDYTFFAADNEVRRLGNVHVWGSFTPAGGSSPFQFIVVWTPILQGSRLLLPPSLLPPGVRDRGLVDPATNLQNSEAAARIVYKGEGWDAAISGFRGFNHDPELYIESLDATGVTLAETYRHIWGGGLEASVSAGDWVFRFEGAYVQTEKLLAGDAAHQPSHVDGVLGVERPFFERLRVQLQAVARGYVNHPGTVHAPPNPDPILGAAADGAAQANAVLLNYQDAIVPAGTLRLAYANEDETFEAEVVGVANFSTHGVARTNYLLRPMVTYHVSDALKLLVGAETFGGPRDTPVGSLRPFSGAFVGGGYRF